MSLIEFNQVRLEVNGRVLVNDFNFSMEEGEHVGVIGPSGAGKTTFLNLFLGMIKPTSGRIQVFGKDLQELNESALESIRMKMGMLFQTNALFSEWMCMRILLQCATILMYQSQFLDSLCY